MLVHQNGQKTNFWTCEMCPRASMTLRYKCTRWVRGNRGSIRRTFFPLSHILLLPRRKFLFLVQPSLCVRPPGLCQVERCRVEAVSEWEGQWVSEWGWGRRLPTNPTSTYVCQCARGRSSCLTWCASQMTSVCLLLVQSAEHRHRTFPLWKLYFEFPGIPLVVFVQVLAYFFFPH